MLAQLEGGRNAHRFDGGIDAAATGHRMTVFDGLAVGAVDAAVAPKRLCDVQAMVVDIDHDDLGRRVELGGEQRGEAMGPAPTIATVFPG